MRFSRTIIPAALAALLNIGAANAQPAQSQPTAQSAQAPATLTPASQAAAPIFSTGYVVPKTSAVITAKISSYVARVAGEAGTKVRRGQTLVKLEDAEFAANLAMARARRDEASAISENAEANFERMKTLLEKGSATKSSFDDAKMAKGRAAASVAMAEAEVKKAEVYFGYTNITSPVDGVIESKQVEVGELTSPGQPLMKVSDTKNLRFETTVKESDVNFIRPGDNVTVAIDALGGAAVAGRVASVSPAGDRLSHSFIVRIDLASTEGLKSGMYGKVKWR